VAAIDDAGAIRDGFAHLRDDEEMLPLADAARCRSEADWLIGINGTRAMTAFNSKEGGFYLTTVGRVQTPTLSIVVEREEKIKKFVPRDYWEVRAEFVCAAGMYEGRWLDKVQEGRRRSREARRAPVEQGGCRPIVAACRGKPGTSPKNPSRPRRCRRACST
jgi:DNA topoisomerase-3